ncbi:MAG: phosphatase PAP2 family protein, partial [Acidimicrobiales bacterium]
MPAAVVRRLDPDERYGLRLTLFAAAFLLVAVPFGLLLAQIEGDGPLARFDTAAARDLHGWVRRSPGAVSGLKVLTFLGAPLWFYFLVIPALVFLLRRGRRRLAVFLVVTTFGGGLLDTAVKYAVNRPRPLFVDPVATAHGRSFPSGHAMSSTVVYGSLL